MIVLGIDTATTATAVGLRLQDGSVLERRDDPPAGSHPGHATRLLAMTEELLHAGATPWDALERVAVGRGPGSFTGLRVGVATAHGIAASRSLELVGVSSLRALALTALAPELAPGDGEGRSVAARTQGAGPQGAPVQEAVLTVIDARRGEVFAAAYEAGPDGLPRELSAPVTLAPEQLRGLLDGVPRERERERALGGDGASDEAPGWRVVGDGAVRYAQQLAGLGLTVEPEDSSLHRVAAAAICELGARADPPSRAAEVMPDYLRRPDAELALESAQGA